MAWFVVGPIAGAGIRFASKKLAENFVKKAGGKITQTLGKTKQSIGATTKKFKEMWKEAKQINKASGEGISKADAIGGFGSAGVGGPLSLWHKSKVKKQKEKNKRLGINSGKK